MRGRGGAGRGRWKVGGGRGRTIHQLPMQVETKENI